MNQAQNNAERPHFKARETRLEDIFDIKKCNFT